MIVAHIYTVAFQVIEAKRSDRQPGAVRSTAQGLPARL